MRLGVIPYLNVQPMIAGLDWPRIETVPSKLAELLMAGAVDLAIMPIVELFENPEFQVIPGMAIGSRGPVKTVKLLSTVPLDRHAATIQLDCESRTSNLLLKVILTEHFGIDLARIHFTLPAKQDPDGHRLVIGDKAGLAEAPIEFDLGEIWNEMTGLPFVYAGWIVRGSQPPPEIVEALKGTLAKNLRSLDRLAKTLAPQVKGWSAPLIKEYLGSNVRYALGPEEMAGLKRFHELLVRHGLVAHPLNRSLLDATAA